MSQPDEQERSIYLSLAHRVWHILDNPTIDNTEAVDLNPVYLGNHRFRSVLYV
jgi:hypothetical protein